MFGFFKNMFIGLLITCTIAKLGESLASDFNGHKMCIYKQSTMSN